jgi:hypothetical protein
VSRATDRKLKRADLQVQTNHISAWGEGSAVKEKAA